MSGFSDVGEERVGPGARIYAEGWQSWSPTAWWPVAGEGLRFGSERPEQEWQHLMRFRPDRRAPADGVQGEGLLVVDPGEGRPVVRYAIGEASESVSTIRAESAAPGVVRVTAEGPVVRTEHVDGGAALGSFGAEFGARTGVVRRPAPRVWCSWYRYFEAVTASDIIENLERIEELGWPVDVIQIDDGWSPGLGEGASVAARFGDLAGAVGRIRESGRTAGLWLAPFLVGRDSTLARANPEWVLGPAGFNWGTELVGLDLTHPGVREYLAAVVERLVGLGIGYLKLDFLYGGAVAGERWRDVSPVAAYRSGLELIRRAAGPDVFVLGCGAPILPSVGLVDAMRISPDTFHEDAQDGSRGLRGARSLRARAWQHGRLWVNDPDCLVMRPSFPLRDEWAACVRREAAGAGVGPWLRSFSDRVAELDGHGRAVIGEYLAG